MKPGIYHDIENDAYHAGEGVSKSQLDDIAIDPSVYKWRKDAPEDDEKKDALIEGTALHCALLEPDMFESRFIRAPEFNRRSNEGKQQEKDFLDECKSLGKQVLDFEMHRKLKLMQKSAFAHPAAKYLLNADGHCESSIYITDEDTDELVRIRPDKYLTGRPVIIDVKKVAEMGRFARHIEEFRYHVQDAMYSDVFRVATGEMPTFLFIAVSSSIDCGRYPVRVFELESEWKSDGYDAYRSNLEKFHECRVSGNWGGIEQIERPAWARRK